MHASEKLSTGDFQQYLKTYETKTQDERMTEIVDRLLKDFMSEQKSHMDKQFAEI